MSKYQPAYNQAKKKSQREMVPAIKDQIDDLKTQIRIATDPDMKKGLKSRLKALEIKMKSYRKGDPVKEEEEFDEEAQGSVSTGSIGVSTAVNGSGETIPSPTDSSHIHPKHMGTFSRKGGYKKPIHDDGRKKKKKKKKNESFVEHYFSESSEILNIIYQIKKILRKPENYVERNHKTVGGMWSVDTWEKNGIMYQLMDEGYTDRIFSKDLQLDVVQTASFEPKFKEGSIEELKEALRLLNSGEEDA